MLTHAGMLIAPRHDGTADLIDPASGRWVSLPTVRSAKWHATVWDRLRSRLMLDSSYPTTDMQDMPDMTDYVRRMEHTYPHLTGELQ